MKLAIFGGSFDPPHLGHEAIIQTAIKKLDLDMLLVIPTWRSPFKSSFSAPPSARLAWVEKAWGAFPKVRVLAYEVDQQRPVPTIETVLHVKAQYQPKKLYIIIGEDHVPTLGQWHDIDTLRALATFVVATRVSKDRKPAPTSSHGLKKLPIHATISSSELRETLNASALPAPIVNEVINYYTLRNPMKERIERIVALLDEKKAENIQVFDMKGKEYFVEQVIIATTLGERHGLALLEDLKDTLKPTGEEFLHVDPASEWVVVDLGDMLVHLMTPTYRARYNLEEFLVDFEKAKM